MKRFGQWPLAGQKYIRRAGVYAILPMGPQLLVTFQGGIHQELQLPGGGIDAGESPLAALHREVMEETGWRISNPRFFTRFKRYVFMPDYDIWAEKICNIYIARPTRQITGPIEPDHTAVFINAYDAAPKLSVDGDRDAVARLFGARAP